MHVHSILFYLGYILLVGEMCFCVGDKGVGNVFYSCSTQI